MFSKIVIVIVLLQGYMLNACFPQQSNTLFKAFNLWTNNDPSTHTGELRRFECRNKQNGFYGDPTDCSPDYVECWNEITLLAQSCSGDKIFDETLCTCVLLEDSSPNCKRVDSFNCNGKPDGLYGDPTDCSQNYVICISGIQTSSLSCPQDQIFDETLGKCVAPAAASSKCKESTTTTATTPKTTTLSFTLDPNNPTCTGVPDGLYPISDCDGSYYNCSGEELTSVECPFPNYVFDPDTLDCTYYLFVTGCQTSSPLESSRQRPFFCPEPEGNFPIPAGCCNVYYSCHSSVATLMECTGSPTDIFDPKDLICTSVDKASCSPSLCE